jgi:hypothetical protein
MQKAKQSLTIITCTLAVWTAVSCGSAPTEAPAQPAAKSQKPFQKLTAEQTDNVCQWITPNILKPLFGLEAATFSPARSAGGLTYQCDQMGALERGGVQVSFHLKPFDNQEMYETSLETAQMAADFQKAKKLPLGTLATITHAVVPGGGQITSLLQLYGSSYALDVTAQYQGGLQEADLEKALISIAKAYVEKNP